MSFFRRAISHERWALILLPCLDIPIPCFRAGRFYPDGHQEIVLSGLDRLSKNIEKIVRFPNGMIGGQNDHNAFRIYSLQMKSGKSERRRGISGLRFQDDILVPRPLELRGQLKTDRISQRLVRYDKYILRPNERDDPADRFAYKRVPSPDLEQLLRHLLTGERPEPRSRTTCHDNCVHV